MSWEKVKRGLVLEGGGARGAHTAGMLMALIEAGLPPFDVVCATSAGAAPGLLRRLRSASRPFWKSICCAGAILRFA